MYPIEDIQLANILENDKDDTFRNYDLNYKNLLIETEKKGSSPTHQQLTRRWIEMFENLEKSYDDPEEGLKRFTQAYLACVSAVDDNIGQVINAIDNSRLKDNTIIILVSDHGWTMGEKDHVYKNSLWEESTRIPMTIRAPGVTKFKSKVTHPVSLIDIFPTLQDICNLKGNITKDKKPYKADGFSLKPFLKNGRCTFYKQPTKEFLLEMIWTQLSEGEKYDFVYILDKVNKPAIAAKIAKIKNIIGPGFKNQKKWLTVKNFLNEEDLKLNYSERSQKLLKINSITIENKYPNLEIDVESLKKNNSDLILDGKKIAFGVDSFEDYKMWYEEDFIKLADLLFEKKLFNYVYLICSPEKSHIAKKIIAESNKNYFIDCSNKDLQGVILAIKNSDFFLGNNSGPLNLAAALGIKSFGLIANDPVSELKYSKIIPIVPKDYVDNVWHRDRKGMKNLKPDEVFNQVIENL